MSQVSLDELIILLDDTRHASRALLEGIDPNQVIYKESGWRTRDLIGHMTDWDIEAVRGFDAYTRGEVYQIPDFTGFDTYNHAKAKARWNQPFDAVFADWEDTHIALKASARALPAVKLGEIVPYPWHDNGSLRLMVRIMADHEHEHVQDIVKATQQGK
jgi:hypothetical protein